VPDLWNELTEKLGGLVGKWASFAAFGTFLLYLFGYLALRFQLSTYGVATNLDVFDERYLFAGSRYVVYLVSAVPNVLLIVLALISIAYLPYRLIPAAARARFQQWCDAWASPPVRVPLLGTLLALGMIQFVLRKCFVFGNLLFATHLSEYRWLNSLLLADDAIKSLFFSGVVGGTLLTGVLLQYALRAGSAATSLSKLLVGLLAFLFAVEFLLLPVNYGILIASQELPRVADMGASEKLSGGEQAWLLWESKEANVYFVREADDKREMITIPEKNAKIKIVGYDPIFQVLFGAAQTIPQPASQKGVGRD